MCVGMHVYCTDALVDSTGAMLVLACTISEALGMCTCQGSRAIRGAEYLCLLLRACRPQPPKRCYSCHVEGSRPLRRRMLWCRLTCCASCHARHAPACTAMQ